jgi:hypothetical protein
MTASLVMTGMTASGMLSEHAAENRANAQGAGIPALVGGRGAGNPATVGPRRALGP